MDLYKAIEEVFHTSYRRIKTDNMPVLVRRGTRNNLAVLFRKLGLNRGVEIGTRYGTYAKILCEANPDLYLTCVDPYLAYHGIKQEKQDMIKAKALANLAPYNVNFIFKSSMDALFDFEDKSLDFVFIDGNHTFDFACPDLIFWSYKVRKGGIVAMHDYMPGHSAGVMQCVDAYTHCHRINPWFVTREHIATAFWVKG